MADLAAITLGNSIPAQPALVAPANIVDGENGGVRVDPKAPTPVVEKPLDKKTYEQLEKDYNELRTKMSQEGAPKPPATDKPADVAVVAPTGEVAAKAVTDAGLDMAALEAEYAEKGVLSEESLAKLEKHGLTRPQVDAYIKGQEARGAQLRTEFATIAGGDDRLSAVFEWAAANMAAADLDNYNGFIDSGNTEGAKLMLKGIVASYESINGRAPNLLTGDGGSRGGSIAPYDSNAQMVKDMSSPEYATDPAFRAKVQGRLSVTKSFAR